MLEMLEIVLNVAIAVFIAGVLFTAGLEVTLQEVFRPMKNVGLVARALTTNILLVPLIVYGMSIFFPLERPYMIGVLLYGFASGAPYTPKLVAAAGGDVPNSIAATMLLTVLTILYMPLILPFLVPGAEIGVWEIAKPLLLQMFVPLVIGLSIRHYGEATATKLHKPANVVVNLSALVFLVLALVLHWDELAATVGTGAVASAVVLTVVAFGVGYLFGPGRLRGRVTRGVITTARNIGAAATIATANFRDDPRVLITVAVCMFVVFLLAFPVSKLYFNRRLGESTVSP
ncbi:MAG: bile acid:sodium symporter [Myxococcales bacterium]|nr:MAG: bile acid:sodium symporter [Myxococcales bacterium]